MRRILSAGLVAATVLMSAAIGQDLFLAPGSTEQGDYLRGVGFAAMGMGQYNLNTAQAYSIVADTDIKVDTYIRAVRKAEAQARAKKRIERQARFVKALADIRERLLKNPTMYDIRMGDAHNVLYEELSRFTGSEYRGSQVPLSADVVRRIPFFLPAAGQVISIPRMLHRDKDWPIAFQDHAFDRDRAAYDAAMRRALDQFTEVDMQQDAIAKVKEAIASLDRQLKKRTDLDKDYVEAVNHLDDLRKYAEMLKVKNAQHVVADFNTYSGTTLEELIQFMNDHNLRFAVPGRPWEASAYRELYAAMDARRAMLPIGGESKSEIGGESRSEK